MVSAVDKESKSGDGVLNASRHREHLPSARNMQRYHETMYQDTSDADVAPRDEGHKNTPSVKNVEEGLPQYDPDRERKRSGRVKNSDGEESGTDLEPSSSCTAHIASYFVAANPRLDVHGRNNDVARATAFTRGNVAVRFEPTDHDFEFREGIAYW